MGTFLGRYRLGDALHKSATCVVLTAEDVTAAESKSSVVLKLMKGREGFENELRSRFADGRDLSNCVIPVVGWHAPEAERAGFVVGGREAEPQPTDGAAESDKYPCVRSKARSLLAALLSYTAMSTHIVGESRK